MYLRSLSFVMYKAVRDLYPDAKLKILHSISGGKYCEIENIETHVNDNLSSSISQRMREIIEENIPFKRMEILTEEAIKIFNENNLPEKKLLFSTRNLLYTSVYKLGDAINYYYGFLVPLNYFFKSI